MKDENIIEPEWEADRRESGRERRRREEREREALRAAAQQLADMQGRRDVSLDDDDTVELRGGRPGGDASFDGGNVAVRDARRGRDRDASLDEADEENVVELRGARRRHRDTPREDPDVVELRPSASGIAAGAGDAATGAAGVSAGAGMVAEGRQGVPGTGGKRSGRGQQAGDGEQAPWEEPQPDPFAAGKPEPSKLRKYLGGIVSGSILTREEVRRSYKYLAVLMVMMLGYMTYTFDFQRLYHREELLTNQVRELRAQAMTLASMRMNATRQSVVTAGLQARGSDVHESVTPPKVIEK